MSNPEVAIFGDQLKRLVLVCHFVHISNILSLCLLLFISFVLRDVNQNAWAGFYRLPSTDLFKTINLPHLETKKHHKEIKTPVKRC